MFLVELICRPDGTKKAYVRLTADVDALDTANKVCQAFLIEADFLDRNDLRRMSLELVAFQGE